VKRFLTLSQKLSLSAEKACRYHQSLGFLTYLKISSKQRLSKMVTDELIFRLRQVAATKRADCPHLLEEAAKRLGDMNKELKDTKRANSSFQRIIKRMQND